MQAIGPVVAWAAGKRELAKIDLSKAFHAIPVVEEQQCYYAFLDRRGQAYKYQRMPMGAMCAPKHFAVVMSKVLGDLVDNDKVNVRSYQDDIIVAGMSKGEVEARYRRVITHLRRYNFKINAKKSSMSDDIVILGYQFSPDKISIPQKKSEEIRLKLRSSCAADVVKATHQLTYAGGHGGYLQRSNRDDGITGPY
ncbi:putative reverse transcriptase [Gregarina niphandrodes]|uniref:Reverse transcriptase n=1 Tax=Gregarina niphandrodes TaxID=110365 RepID=A0A023AW73_GRENI|nr:putative reverse transcriptase [Gregarina niphandrodes]EZG42981.1 putative reverse transcriptase [Gregarina niphandrodes]|eukprot:XP_011133746.1 putative reverse transcriptase [Gregarina niphandrodes]